MLPALPQLNDSQYSYSPSPIAPVTSKFKRQNLFFAMLKGPWVGQMT